MKKNSLLFSFFFTLLMSILSGCGKTDNVQTANNQINTTVAPTPITTVITSISIDTVEANPDNIWRINWPQGYYSKGLQRVSFANIQDMAEDEPLFIYEFIKGLPDNYTVTDNSVYLGEIFMTCDITEGDKTSSELISKSIYDKYPDGYGDFVKIINRICGGDKQYLCMNGKPQEITPEYFSYRTDLTDNSVKSGTLQDMIAFLDLNMQKLNWKTPAELAEYGINYPVLKYLPYDIKNVPSTEEAAQAYAGSLAEKLGVDPEAIVKNKAPYEDIEFFEFATEDFPSVRVYRTESFPLINFEKSTFDRWQLCENVAAPGDEPQGCNVYDFIYSSNGAFAVAVNGGNDEHFYDCLTSLGDTVSCLVSE